MSSSEKPFVGRVYVVTNTVTGKQYVGQTIQDVERRWRDHVSAARAGRSHCKLLARSIIKHGSEAFTVEVVETCSAPDALDQAEARWVRQLNTMVPTGYNLLHGGQGRGRGHSAETRAKIGDALRGRRFTPEHCARISAAQAGRKRPPEVMAKVQAANRGRKYGPLDEARRQVLIESNRRRKGTRIGCKRDPESVARGVQTRLRTVSRRRFHCAAVALSRQLGLSLADVASGVLQ